MKALIASTLLVLTLQAHAQTSDAPVNNTAPAFVTTVQNDEKENLLADNFERTLYVFDVDQNTKSSKCVGDCAELWPAYLITADEAKGLQAPLGTITRANKKLQLTYKSRPVYTYALDRVKGDDHGDGLGGVWHYVEVK